MGLEDRALWEQPEHGTGGWSAVWPWNSWGLGLGVMPTLEDVGVPVEALQGLGHRA